MRLSDAVSYFGTQQKLADALQIKQGAISSWDEDKIPMARALQIEKITEGKLKADLSLYVRPSKQASQ
jgi:DNA-binding transcriptional regulator YdaS (Cro superfamily)